MKEMLLGENLLCVEDCTQKYSLEDLFYQKSDALIRDQKMKESILNSIRYFCNIFLESIHVFCADRSIGRFDPHVGDTACQIRALRLLEIGSYTLDKADYILNLIRGLLRKMDYPDTFFYGKNNQISIGGFLSSLQEGCSFKIPEDMFFLYLSYFLTKFKYENNKGEIVINYQDLSKEAKISIKSSKKVVRFYQIQLSKISCKDVLRWSYIVDRNSMYYLSLKTLLKLDDDGRYVFPCYVYNKIILEVIKKKKMTVFVKVYRESIDQSKTTNIIFIDGENKGEIFKRDIVNRLDGKYCFFITGLSYRGIFGLESDEEFICRLNKIGFEKVFLSNMATHPQYTGKKLKRFSRDPFLDEGALEDYQRALRSEMNSVFLLGSSLGCSSDDKSLFFVQHVCCESFLNLKIFPGEGLKHSEESCTILNH